MFTQSIRWRLQLWLAFLLATVLCGFGITAYQLHRINRFQQVDEELERRVAAVAADVRARPPFGRPRGRLPFEPRFEPKPEGPGAHRPGTPPPAPPGSPEGWFDSREVQVSPSTEALFEPGTTNGFYYAVWSRGGTLLKASPNAPTDLPVPASLQADTRIQARTRGTRREALQFSGMGDCILAGRSIAADVAALRSFGWWLALAGTAVLGIGLSGGWLLASRAIRPLDNISAAARRIAAGNLAERIDLAETDGELGRLAGVLNSTFARLEAAFAQQKQFTADASHELRTPIAVILSETQTTLTRERTAGEYRETVETCLAIAQQMRGLTHSLLELARFDAGEERLDRQPFDLAARVRLSIDLIRPLAAERAIRLLDDLHPVEISGDPNRIGQVITNLLTNAVQYNRQDGEVRIVTEASGASGVVTVADTGPGLAPEDRPHVFERFYRGDKARSRAEGHSGLGLAICKAIVDAHGGTIAVENPPEGGSRFTVRLPR